MGEMMGKEREELGKLRRNFGRFDEHGRAVVHFTHIDRIQATNNKASFSVFPPLLVKHRKLVRTVYVRPATIVYAFSEYILFDSSLERGESERRRSS
jgi:hypothetical protein